MRSIIDEARVLARVRGRNTVGALDIKRAIQFRQRSDLAIRVFRVNPKKPQVSSYRRACAPNLPSQEPALDQEQITNPSRSGDGEPPPICTRSTRVSLTVP
jgi:hypothetical protein